MNKNEIIEFINSNPCCHVATVENEKPHVRMMFLYKADKDGIVFHTGNYKDLYSQLVKNSNVELCVSNADNSIQLRVAGSAELNEDMSLRDEIIKARPFLKPVLKAKGDDMLKVYTLQKMKAHVWTMETNMMPKEYVIF